MMAFYWTNLMTILLHICKTMKRTRFLFSLTNLSLIYTLSILRVCLPIELPFTKVIPCKALYNWWANALFTKKIYQCSVFSILITIWISIALLLLIRYLYHYYMIFLQLKSISHINNDILEKDVIKEQINGYKKIRILCSDKFRTPMQVGLLHPYLLIPNLKYNEQTMHYILLHEMTHFYHRDTLVLIILNIWKCIFWWNPFSYLLSYNIKECLEYNCDSAIVSSMNNDSRKEYLSSILEVYCSVSEDSSCSPNYKECTLSFAAKDSENQLQRRFTRVAQNRKMKYSHMYSIVIIFLWLFSYCFIFQSQYEIPNEDIYDCEYLDSSDVFILEKENETYQIIVDNKSYGEISKQEVEEFIKFGYEVKKRYE